MHLESENYQVLPEAADEKKATGLPPDLQIMAIEFMKNAPPQFFLSNKPPSLTEKMWTSVINSIRSCDYLFDQKAEAYICPTVCCRLCCCLTSGSLALLATPITLLGDCAIKSHQNYEDNRTAAFFFSMENPQKLTEYINMPVRQQMG